MGKIILKGWQSWTPCKTSPLQFRRPCDFSPQNITFWRVNSSSNLKRPIKGWCSWYAYGLEISESKIIDNAVRLKDFWPGENKYVLIDDGWTKCGDWLTQNPNKFPKGMMSVANKIKGMDLRPGIWISPFLADPNSGLVKKHPEYFIKDNNRFVDGFRISPINLPFINKKYILDLEKPEVISYLKKCLHKIIVGWKFELLKLDFLYAIYFNPKYKDSKIPDQILGEFLSYIKKSYPNTYTVGCGCPLGPAAGLLDAMRISSDIISPQLDNFWPINSIINSQKLNQLEKNLKSRKDFSSVWNIDPDVFISRSSTGLNSKKVSKLYELIKSANGLFFLGDDLTQIDVNQRFISQVYRKTPLISDSN